MEKRLSDALFLAVQNLANSIAVKDEATIDAYKGIISSRLKGNRGCLYTFGVGFWRCSFYGNGQCESHGLRDE